MPLAQAVLAVLLALPAPYCPPRATCSTETQHRAHLEVVARAIAGAADRATCSGTWSQAADDVCQPLWPGSARELAAVLVAVGWWESRLSWRVQAGRCPWSGCSRWNRRAHSIWQVERSPAVSATLWRGIVGTRPVQVQEAAWTAARLLALARGRCGHRRAWLPATISGYATGARCHWAGVGGRVWMGRQVETRLLLWRTHGRRE